MATTRKKVTRQQEDFAFQSEAKQLLKLMTHSVYSNREIFLRELVSNAADAIERLKFESITHPELLPASEPDIRVSFDKAAGTLSVIDRGIGMSRQEVIDNLGTIAKSGTARFLESLGGNEQKNAQLIGQFGVGFYSSFIVADKVTVLTRRADSKAEEGTRFESTGEEHFTLSEVSLDECGTTVILHLNAEGQKFLDRIRLKAIIQRYTNHLDIHVSLLKEQADGEKDDESEDEEAFEIVNQGEALWRRSRNEIDQEEYDKFYELLTHSSGKPLASSHNKIEGKLNYTTLLFIPEKAPFDLHNRETPRGLKLYVQRVFIMDDAEQFLPLHLRFVRGIVDCDDLPLNVSRELLQEDETVRSIRNAVTKRVMDMLAKMAKSNKDDYQIFWKEFGAVLKEGFLDPGVQPEPLKKLLRFPTLLKDDDSLESLEDYVANAPMAQKKIYYLIAESLDQGRQSPHLEVLKNKKYDALLCCDTIDTWVMMQLDAFDGKILENVAQTDLDLAEVAEKDSTDSAKQEEGANGAFFRSITDLLQGKVKEVRASSRLKDSPACLVADKNGVSEKMRLLIQQATGQTMPESEPVLEINLKHPLVTHMASLMDQKDLFDDLVYMLFDQAWLAENATIRDPAAFVKRLNKLLLNYMHRDDSRPEKASDG